MNGVIITLCLLLCWRIYGVEYGLLFEGEHSYLQMDYTTLCDESELKFEVLINRTSGMLFTAENKARAVKLIVYFVRPGVYMNVSDGDNRYNLLVTVDFFSSDFEGWHDVAVRLTEQFLELKLDNKQKKVMLRGGYVFPEDVVENNEIYFGAAPYWRSVANVTRRFSGVMKNIQFKSCGCNQWRTVRIVKNVGVNVESQGQCAPSTKSCKRECSCYLFSWGGHRCECPTEPCPQANNQVWFIFHKTRDHLGRLQEVSKSNWVSSENGPFGGGMEISSRSSLMLQVTKGRTCFRSVFLCEIGFTYSFWILPTIKSNTKEKFLILKHSSSLETPYGLSVSRILDDIQVSLTTPESNTLQVQWSLTLSVWSLVTITYNQTHLSLFIDSLHKQSSSRFIKLYQKLLDFSSTRFLFVGNNADSPEMSIDKFEFSTNITDTEIHSIQELRLEQYSDLRKINVDCGIFVMEGLVDLTSCYRRAFPKPIVKQFYVSLIINMTEERKTVLIQASFIKVSLESSKVLKIELPGRSSHYVTLRQTTSHLYYIELSLNDKDDFLVLQGLDVTLLNYHVNMDLRLESSLQQGLQVNNDFNLLRSVLIMNTDKSWGSRLLRIMTNIQKYSVDFDNNDIDNYASLPLTEGYVGMGLSLNYLSSQVSSTWFRGSCIQYLKSCFHGVTLTFWLKITHKYQDFNVKYHQIFSSGDKGISLVLEKQALYFVLIVESSSFYKFVTSPADLSFNVWYLLEITISQNGVVSLYLNRKKTKSLPYYLTLRPSTCKGICLGDEGNKEESGSIVVDELVIWNVGRSFLYANEFISAGPSRHKLVSFSAYQQDKSFTLKGSAKIISTKTGYALGLNDFGYRFANINLTDGPVCFWNFNYCRRGISIRMCIRADNLAISQQTLLYNGFLSVTINLQNLVVQINALGKSWYVFNKDVLQLFTWQTIVLSWRSDDGLKVFINEKLSGYMKVGKDNSAVVSRISPTMTVGIEHVNMININYATVVIDDVEFYEGDKSQLAYEAEYRDDSPCFLYFNFDDPTNMNPLLGVVGSARLFKPNSPNIFKIPIPKCFVVVLHGCRMCFTLRLWLNLYKLDTSLLEGGFLKVSVMSRDFVIEINNEGSEKSLQYSCPYGEYEFLNKWNFLEVSWDFDEGLLVFVNREGVTCVLSSENNVKKGFKDAIEISNNFSGALDEIEMYHKRLSLLYWEKIIDEKKVLLIIEKIKEKERILKEVTLLKDALNSAKVNRTVEVVESVQFNGSNYVSYKLPPAIYPYVPGGKEEVEISFMCFNNIRTSIIWISDSKLSKNTLTLKNSKLYFTKLYILPSSNTSKRLTEEIEIHDNILPHVLYNVVISQRAGEVVMKTTSLNESNTQSMIGRVPLLPMNSNVYFGGYNNDQYLESNQVNSHLLGIIYKARLKASSNDKVVDIIQEMTDAKHNPNIVNHGNVKIIKKVIEPNMPQKALFLATLSSAKIPLMINSPFFSLRLPKWDFNILNSIEIEFMTYESIGILFFIGNKTDFLSLEMYDSQLFFLHKQNNVLRRIKTNMNALSVSDHKPYAVYLGRDLSGDIKIYFNRDEVIETSLKITNFDNSVSLIGHIGAYDLWPPEILSRVSFIGCINFIRINDADYINFTQVSSLMKFVVFNFYEEASNLSNPFTRGMCRSPSTDSCQSSPCKGGWCQLTSNSASGLLSNNFLCNCLHTSKALSISFTKESAKANLDLWTYEYLRQVRSKACTEDSTQLVIVAQSSLSLNFRITFPFVSVLDLELLVLVKARYNCITELSLQQRSLSVIISEGMLLINISGDNVITLSDIKLDDHQWHGLRIQGRAQSIRITVGNFHKDFISSLIPSFNVSAIKIGNCGGYQHSSFKIKGFSYNNLNLLNAVSSSDERSFFTSEYKYPVIMEGRPHGGKSSANLPLTFLNSFKEAKTLKPFIITWFTQIQVSFSSIYPGVLFYINNNRRFLVCASLRNKEVAFIHYDNALNARIERVKMSTNKIQFVLTIDLIKEVIKVRETFDSSEQVLSLGIDSWNIGDAVYVQFGVNSSNNDKINLADFDKYEEDHVKKTLVKSVLGCLERFTWSNGDQKISLNEDWTTLMEATPSKSVLVGQCKVVQRCLAESCVNGVCRSDDGLQTFCDCSFTDFTGDRCHEVKDRCLAVNCLNGGKCIATKDYRGADLTYCNCSGTGYTGRVCEDILCEKDFCANNGTCYATSKVKQCNCNFTNYSGPKCEEPVCKRMTCNGHGQCHVVSSTSPPMCHCSKGFFGEYCDVSSSGKCENICKNGGVCSSFQPIFKLCSNQYCQRSRAFSCGCDHTLYRGDMCEQAELGFFPQKDGIVIMTNLSFEKENYLRLLFEPNQQRSECTLLTILKAPQQYTKLLLVNNTLIIKSGNKAKREMFIRTLGNVTNKNVLLLTEKDSSIEFYLNDVIGSFKYSDLKLQYQERYKRDVSAQSSFAPSIIVGCNQEMNNCFSGLLGGVKWNNRLLLDPLNKLFIDGDLHSIERLQVRSFPTQTSFIMLIEKKNFQFKSLFFIIPLILGLFCFVVVRKWYCLRTTPVKAYHNNKNCISSESTLIQHVDVQLTRIAPEYSPDLSSRDQYESKLTVKSILSSDDSMTNSCRILVINDIDSVNRLSVVDCVPVLLNSIVIVTDKVSEIKISRSLFPVDEHDLRHRCLKIGLSPRGNYIYCHMTSLQSGSAVFFEIQAWDITSDYFLLVRPPNLHFTHSSPLMDESYKIVLANNVAFTVSLFDLKKSSTLWTRSLLASYSKMRAPLVIINTSLNIIVNKELLCEIIDMNGGVSDKKLKRPLDTGCRQILDLEEEHFVILTDNYELYHWDMKNDYYDHIQLPHRVTIMARVLRDKTVVALGMESGEVYLPSDDNDEEFTILGPRNDKIITCMTFSLDGRFLAAAYNNNLIHVWKMGNMPGLCHFHAVHEQGVLYNMTFTDENKKLLVEMYEKYDQERNHKKLSIMNITSD